MKYNKKYYTFHVTNVSCILEWLLFFLTSSANLSTGPTGLFGNFTPKVILSLCHRLTSAKTNYDNLYHL